MKKKIQLSWISWTNPSASGGKKVFFLGCLLFCFMQGKAQAWNLVWSDEFDSANVNSTSWTYDTGFSYNNELEYYTSRPQNVTIQNGNLLIIAKKEVYNGANYTSARLKTEGLETWTYGKFESKIKLPIGKGIWPAFWILGQSVGQIGWPKCGEIDIMEHINTEPLIYATMHWDNSGHKQSGSYTSCDVRQYHIYSIEWSAKAIEWFLDGNKFFETNIANNIDSTEELHLPFYVILNLAVGGNWPGNPDGTTPFPDTMFVDYVRVYQNIAVEEPSIADFRLGIVDLQIIKGKIYLSAPKSINMELKIYDLCGREKEVVCQGTLTKGNYTFTPNIKKSGVYFVRLTAGNSKETKKLILVK
ncbi:MAG: family 16 glycosylhydrolase [bacterium]|nr:family 16 glycosylhydrolase [bacterium]